MPGPFPEDLLEKRERGRCSKPRHAAKADIIILSALVPGQKAPILLTQEMVESMQPGSIIVDISI